MNMLLGALILSTAVLGVTTVKAESTCPELSKHILKQAGFLDEQGTIAVDVEKSAIDDNGPAHIAGMVYKKNKNQVIDESMSSHREAKARVAYITLFLNQTIEYVPSKSEDKTYINYTADKNFSIRTDSKCKIDHLSSFDPKLTTTNIGNSFAISSEVCKKLNAGKELSSEIVEMNRDDGIKIIEKQYGIESEDGWISESRLEDAKSLCREFSESLK